MTILSQVKGQIKLESVDSAEKSIWLLGVSIPGGEIVDFNKSEWTVNLE